MYATIAELATQYGLTEVAQLMDDEEGNISAALLQAALDGDTSSYTADEQAAIARAMARADAIISQQQALIDASVAQRYSVPLSDSDARATPVHSCCLALARAGLADDGDNIGEQMAKDRDYWRTWLRDLAKGQLTLPGISVISAGGNTPRQRLTGVARSNVEWSDY